MRRRKETGPVETVRPPPSWLTSKRPVLRFVFWIALPAAIFNLFYYAYFSKTSAFAAFLECNASISAAIMRWFGTEVAAAGASLTGPRFTMTIAMGCDALQPASLFLFAVAASPVAFRLKLPGLLVGGPLLLLVNIVRIVSLYYCGIYRPTWFETLHIDVWQTGFIFLALMMWVAWALWARRATVGQNRAAA